MKITIINIILINFLILNICSAGQDHNNVIQSTKIDYVNKMSTEEVSNSINKYHNITTPASYLSLLNEIKDYCDGLNNFFIVIVSNLQIKNNINLNTEKEITVKFSDSVTENFITNAPNLWEANIICKEKLPRLTSQEISSQDNKVLKLLLVILLNKENSIKNGEMSYLINFAK